MAETEIRVEAGKLDRPAGPVWVTLQDGAGLPEGAAVVVDTETGQPIPAQVVADGAMCLWLDGMKAGSTRTLAVKGPDKAAKARVEVKTPTPNTADVLLDGQPFTTYHGGDDVIRPFLYPVIGPTGKPMTRSFPMKKGVPGEGEDHPHQTSLYTAWGDVNKVDHWSAQRGPNQGYQKHRKFITTASGPVFGRIEVLIEWVDASGRRQLTEHRTYTVYAPMPDVRVLDTQVAFKLTDGDVTFGDTKEGGLFALRVAASMKEAAGGVIVNAAGQRGEKACWGQPAPWCDYSGPVDGTIVGLTILDHPANHGYPTRYHVRAYGLFTANCFGLSHFCKPETKDGTKTWKNGETVVFRYRLLMHTGGADDANLPAHHALFADPPVVRVR
ncbi:MAG: PmoA family protein [Phycisphaerae bacterium]|nr:PmoA family protein [Phycisphaerae bacterium]